MLRSFIAAALAAALAACPAPREPEKAPADQHDHHHGEEHAEAEGDKGMVTIDPEMLRDLRITTSKAEGRASGDGVTVLGELRVDENAYAEVGSPIAARVVKLIAKPGDRLKAGDALVEMESVELGKARAELLSAIARAELARRTLERRKTLAAEQIIPQRELEEAEAEDSAARASLRAAEATLRALGVGEQQDQTVSARFALRSPIAGTVIDRKVVRGRVTDSNAALFRVADLSKLWLTVHAFERDALRVKPNVRARISLPALPGQTFTGTVATIGAEVDVASRTIPVRVDVDNPHRILKPGMSANAWIPIGDEDQSLVAVPAASLQRVQDGWCVFVPRGRGVFEMRAVGRGRDLGGEVEVLSGLRPGETVVVDGAFLLKAESEKARGEGEHHHH